MSNTSGQKTSFTIRVKSIALFYYTTNTRYISYITVFTAYTYDHVGKQERQSTCAENTMRLRAGKLKSNMMFNLLYLFNINKCYFHVNEDFYKTLRRLFNESLSKNIRLIYSFNTTCEFSCFSINIT